MDITDQMDSFREAARHLWNVYFWRDAERDGSWNLRDAFSEVYVALFNSIVRFHLPESAPPIPHLWDPGKTVLAQYQVVGNFDRLVLMINRDKPASGYWDHPTQYVLSSAVDLRLIALFDWDQLGFRDFRYFRVRIIKADDPDLVDRDALAEAADCRVEYVEEKS
ncbi:MAG: hypothetical protein HY343_13395 [Lentisphaerae bacterium]|nr:hypothetical protein [Lentisphaerota bacterium]